MVHICLDANETIYLSVCTIDVYVCTFLGNKYQSVNHITLLSASGIDTLPRGVVRLPSHGWRHSDRNQGINCYSIMVPQRD